MMYLYNQNILIGTVVIVIMITGCALPPAITFLSGAKTTWDIAAIQHEYDHLSGIVFTSKATAYHLGKAKKDQKLRLRRSS